MQITILLSGIGGFRPRGHSKQEKLGAIIALVRVGLV